MSECNKCRCRYLKDHHPSIEVLVGDAATLMDEQIYNHMTGEYTTLPEFDFLDLGQAANTADSMGPPARTHALLLP